MEMKFGKKVFIRNTGKDEYWLQDIIYENPSILGLGDLRVVGKEKRQSSGGRLDILLKDPQDNTMYEVEVMLGETDPSHIIRAIEYWDNEKKRYPQRQHYSVLIAESFERRYFNVVQIISMNVPMIAIQVDLLEPNQADPLESNKEYMLHFTKILDIYIEPDDNEDPPKPVNESSWNEKAEWTLNTAKELLSLIDVDYDKKSINFTQSYISININGKIAYCLNKKAQPTSVLWFNVKDDEKADAIKMIFDSKNILYNYPKSRDFVINVDQNMIKNNTMMFQEIMKIRHKEIYNSE